MMFVCWRVPLKQVSLRRESSSARVSCRNNPLPRVDTDMPHILVAGKIHEDGVALLRSTPGITFDLVNDVSLESYAPLVGMADAIVIRTQPLPASVIANAPRLQIVSRHGVGYDSVDLAALNARG